MRIPPRTPEKFMREIAQIRLGGSGPAGPFSPFPLMKYVACDLGAESGRVMLGTLENGRLSLEEVHRFTNLTVWLDGSWRWDILRTFAELQVGLAKLAARGEQPVSLSVDSWGVDYVWSGLGQTMLAPAYCYRDGRTDSTFDQALAAVGREKIFAETGIQFMSLNTLYQLLADQKFSPGLLDHADGFLCIADYLHFLFSGVRKAEESLASTTQLYNPAVRGWSAALQKAFGLPARIFPEIVASGTRLGSLRPEIAAELGLELSVVATCSHDTGAAVAAAPARGGDDWAYLSSGTWSLLGVELGSSLINEDVRRANYTNEGGYGGTTRFLKNLSGLWILQECRRTWEREGISLSYAELNRLAEAEAPLRTLLDPTDARFTKPGGMPERVAAFARDTGQPVPASPGAMTRAILESLALVYRESLDDLEKLTGRKIRVLHIVGGGSQSALLNQFTADATGRTVEAGPVEATAIGNILIQAIVDGQIPDLAALRAVVRSSFPIQTFQPSGDSAWAEASARLAALRGR